MKKIIITLIAAGLMLTAATTTQAAEPESGAYNEYNYCSICGAYNNYLFGCRVDFLRAQAYLSRHHDYFVANMFDRCNMHPYWQRAK